MQGQVILEIPKMRGYIFDSELMRKLGFPKLRDEEFDTDCLNRFLEFAKLEKYKRKFGTNKLK